MEQRLINRRKKVEEEREDDIGDLIYAETEKRLDEMEQPDYEWPARIGKVDWMLIIAGIVVSIVFIVLCMTGVIL